MAGDEAPAGLDLTTYRYLLTELLNDDPPMPLRVMGFAVEHHLRTCALVQSALMASVEREEHPKQLGFVNRLEAKSDHDFFKNLRVRKETFQHLLSKFTAVYNPRHKGGRKPTSPKTTLFVTLWYLGNSDSFKDIAELFGMSESAVYKCVDRGVNFFCNLAPKYIMWPSPEEVPHVVDDFQKIAGFPGVLGAVDGCRFPIKAPEDVQKADSVDRTATHTVTLMAVCDSHKKFTFIDAGFPGSAPDSTVFSQTKLYRKLKSDSERNLNREYHLIGGSGFQVSPFLLTPYIGERNIDETRITFNKKLLQTWYVIEHSFGLLKRRFGRLKYLDAHMSRIPKIIAACCVLHNITLEYPEEEAALLNDGRDPSCS